MKRSSLIKVTSLMIFCWFGIIQIGFTWPGVDRNGVPICTNTSDQYEPKIVSDDQGGAIIAWYDYRNDSDFSNSDIYAQAINSVGSVKWPLNGVAICTASSYQLYPQLISDGQGGAIITWQDYRNGNGDIYAQAINSTGSVKWTTNGVALCTASNDQTGPKIVSDGQGGAIITWQDDRTGSSDIYAQAIDSTGEVKWTTNGVPICTMANGQFYPQIVSDGQGGAIITWQDYRNGNNYDIYTQAIDSTGSVKWTLDGVATCTASNDQNEPQIVSDNKGGAIITWQDYRNGNNDIYTQAIYSTGSVKWTTNGVAICTTSNDQSGPQLVSDGQGGAIITWYYYDIFAQAIDSTGGVKWIANGVAICTASDYQALSKLVSDGHGGAVITWQDRRKGEGNNDIYAQAINSTGSVKWTTNGVPICKASGSQITPQIASDGQGGAIITWQDLRNVNSDIYAQSIDENGQGVGLLMTRLTDLKLFLNQSLDSVINIEDQFAGENVNYLSILDNFLGLCSVNEDYLSQAAYALATTGINSFDIHGSFGYTTSESAVKYSSYKLKKLPYLGLIPGTSQDFPIYQYAFNSIGRVIPQSFGNTDALSTSDTTKITAVWLNSSTIRITVGVSFNTTGYVDIIASPVISKPFGVNMDRERLYIFPSILTVGQFINSSDTGIFVYQNAIDRTQLATISQLSTVMDAKGESASGILKIDFSNASSGIKATLITSQWKNYQTGKWYTARIRICSPDTSNQHQAVLYQYSNPVLVNNHVDIGAYVSYGVPTVWTWIEQPLYCQLSGSGYPQLILKGGSTGSLYIDEIQLINNPPALIDNLRNPGDMKYPYGHFDSASETTGWAFQSLAGDSGPMMIPPIDVDGNMLVFDYRSIDSGLNINIMGVKATATNAIPGGIYTPENLPNAEIGMKMDYVRYYGHATTSNALIALYMFGVQTSGQFEIGKTPSELIAVGEFGPLRNGTHYVIGKSISPYHQFQFKLKNDAASILTIDNIEMFQDRDDDIYGESSLFP